MARHDHQLHEGESLKTAARDRLTQQGEQWTDMRASVFEALASFDKPASAYDIAEEVSKRQGRRVAANSVYRILDLFVNANLARRVESANAYVANAHPDCLHDCIFLICDQCGQTVHIDDDSLSGGVRQAAKSAGFSAPRPGDRGARDLRRLRRELTRLRLAPTFLAAANRRRGSGELRRGARKRSPRQTGLMTQFPPFSRSDRSPAVHAGRKADVLSKNDQLSE